MLKRFLNSAQANAPVETIVVIPFLIWGLVLMQTLSDSFVKRYKAVQSTYAIADAISRETEHVSAADVEGLNALHAQMTEAPSPTATRVTLIHYDADLGRIELDWSYATAGILAHDETTLIELENRAPPLSHGEPLIFVETYRNYTPRFTDFTGHINIDTKAFARLRYAPTLAWHEP